MSFSTGCRKCEKCGKMYLINLFDGGLCAECEKDMPCITPEEMQKCKDVVKKYTPKQEPCRVKNELKVELNELEPCDDVVSRQAVIGEFKDMYKAAERWSQDATEDDIKARADAVMATLIEQKLRVEALPSVRPQEQTGHWIEDDMTYCGVDLTNYKCDKCGEMGGSWRKGLKHDKLPKYCMNCGCRMVEPQESEDKE